MTSAAHLTNAQTEKETAYDLYGKGDNNRAGGFSGGDGCASGRVIDTADARAQLLVPPLPVNRKRFRSAPSIGINRKVNYWTSLPSIGRIAIPSIGNIVGCIHCTIHGNAASRHFERQRVFKGWSPSHAFMCVFVKQQCWCLNFYLHYFGRHGFKVSDGNSDLGPIWLFFYRFGFNFKDQRFSAHSPIIISGADIVKNSRYGGNRNTCKSKQGVDVSLFHLRISIGCCDDLNGDGWPVFNKGGSSNYFHEALNQPHLTNALRSDMVALQQGKCPVVGITNLSELRRMTSRARNGSGFFMVRRSGPRERAVPQCGVCNPVRLAAHEITNSDGQVFETLLRSLLMAQKTHSTIPTTVKFENTKLSIIDRDGQPWITSTDLAKALGYSGTNKVAGLFSRNSNEFTADMSTVLKLGTVGNAKRPTRIFSPRGCHLIAIFARTDKATAFRKWVLDVLEGLQAAPTPAPLPLALPPLPLRKVCPLDRQAALEHLIRRLRDHHPTVTYAIALDREDIADELERLGLEPETPKGKTNVRAHLRKLPRKGAA